MKQSVTTIFDHNPKVKQFRLSSKFDITSVYYDGVYYFPYDDDIHKHQRNNDKHIGIQCIYYRGKWYQDTMYITDDFLKSLQDFITKN